MKAFRTAILLATLLLLQRGFASAQSKAPSVFFLEDTARNQWCAFNSEAPWNAAVQDAGAMTVGALTYSNDLLSQLDVTETDESGDWTVYDHYFVDEHGQLVRLSRMINILPGDRSVSQTFSISEGKATKTATTAKQLSSGKPLTSPKPIWLPKLPIETNIKMFPFAALLERSDLRTSNKSCVKIGGRR